jgi:early secretory antigenic target protein ESAT-6
MSTTDQLIVDFAAMQAGSTDINGALRSLHGHLEELQTAAGPLVATWSGDAQAAYAQRQQTWTNAANDLAGMLKDIQTALDDSIADYLHTEKGNTNLFHH